jgi:hypothetical protein
MWVSASGVRERLVPIGSGGLNITTTSSDSGEVFVTYTDLHECPVTDPPVPDGYKCSFVWLVGLRDGVEETTSQLFSGPREVLSPFVGFAGRPHIAIGKGQVLAEVYSSDPHACGSDNCIPYGVEFQYRTKLVTTAGVSRRESFTWY